MLKTVMYYLTDSDHVKLNLKNLKMHVCAHTHTQYNYHIYYRAF